MTYVLAVNSRILEVNWGNLCIGVDARSLLCFSGRNLGALFEVLCVGLSIINLKLFDAYHIINSWILVVTLEYLGDIGAIPINVTNSNVT